MMNPKPYWLAFVGLIVVAFSGIAFGQQQKLSFNLESEEWKAIGTPDRFQVNSIGKLRRGYIQPNFINHLPAPNADSYYAGIILYNNNRSKREYLTIPLFAPIDSGSQIVIDLSATIGGDKFPDGEYFNQIQMGLSTNLPSRPSGEEILPKAQFDTIIESRSRSLAISDWKTIRFNTTIHEGNIQYITLGNFLPDSAIGDEYRATPNIYSYAFLDQLIITVTPPPMEVVPLDTKPALIDVNNLPWERGAGVIDTIKNTAPISEGVYIDITKPIRFDSVVFFLDSAVLLNEEVAVKELEIVKRVLLANPNMRITVHGHTARGISGLSVEKKLQALSDARAKLISEILSDRYDIDNSIIDFVGHGSKQLIDPNAAYNTRNTRIEISFHIRTDFRKPGRNELLINRRATVFSAPTLNSDNYPNRIPPGEYFRIKDKTPAYEDYKWGDSYYKGFWYKINIDNEEYWVHDSFTNFRIEYTSTIHWVQNDGGESLSEIANKYSSTYEINEEWIRLLNPSIPSDSDIVPKGTPLFLRLYKKEDLE